METPSSTKATVRKQTMKAIVQERYGMPERVLKLEEVERPAIGRPRRLDSGAGHQREHPGLGSRWLASPTSSG